MGRTLESADAARAPRIAAAARIAAASRIAAAARRAGAAQARIAAAARCADAVRARIAVALVAGAAALAAGTACAHHSFSAEFDDDRPVQLTGKVTEMRWANPHAWIYIDVEEPDGTVVNWALEMGGANGLIRRGWRREDLPAGTVLRVEGWQARNGSPTANISSVTFEDGRRLFAGTSNPAAE